MAQKMQQSPVWQLFPLIEYLYSHWMDEFVTSANHRWLGVCVGAAIRLKTIQFFLRVESHRQFSLNFLLFLLAFSVSLSRTLSVALSISFPFSLYLSWNRVALLNLPFPLLPLSPLIASRVYFLSPQLRHEKVQAFRSMRDDFESLRVYIW